MASSIAWISVTAKKGVHLLLLIQIQLWFARSLTHIDPLEIQYYSSTLVLFPNVYFHCGMGEQSSVEDANILDSKAICYSSPHMLIMLLQ